MTLPGKTVDQSAVRDYIHRIFPTDLNSNGSVFGGFVMAILDRICSVVAERHSGRLCVTASVDSLNFLQPAREGDILVCMSSVNRAWRTSMEVGAKVVAENYGSQEKKHIVSAYFTFVALDENQRPIEVPPLIAETEAQKRRFEAAGLRRELRFKG